MNTNMTTSHPPSAAADYLKSCLNKRVEKLIRFSWWPADEVSAQCGVVENFAFASTAGPLAIYFDGGAVLGVASDPALNSILIWNEAARRVINGDRGLEQDGELFQISASDQRYSTEYWGGIAGRRLMSMSILKKASMSETEARLPSEVGLKLSFDNGSALIASHGLHDRSDDFSILQESQILGRELRYLVIE